MSFTFFLVFYFELWRPFCAVKWNHLPILIKGHMTNISKIILKSAQWLTRKCRLKLFFFFFFFFFFFCFVLFCFVLFFCCFLFIYLFFFFFFSSGGHFI